MSIRRKVYYTLILLLLAGIFLLLGVLVGMNLITNNTSLNSENTQQNGNREEIVDENENNSSFEDEIQITQHKLPETLEEFIEDAEALVEQELLRAGDASLWIDNETAMNRFTGQKVYTPMEAASVHNYFLGYFEAIGVEVHAEASFQNPDLARGNILIASKGDLKFSISFLEVDTTSPNAYIQVAVAGL